MSSSALCPIEAKLAERAEALVPCRNDALQPVAGIVRSPKAPQHTILPVHARGQDNTQVPPLRRAPRAQGVRTVVGGDGAPAAVRALHTSVLVGAERRRPTVLRSTHPPPTR